MLISGILFQLIFSLYEFSQISPWEFVSEILEHFDLLMCGEVQENQLYVVDK